MARLVRVRIELADWKMEHCCICVEVKLHSAAGVFAKLRGIDLRLSPKSFLSIFVTLL